MINLLIALVIIGAALYLLNLIPLDPTVKRVIQAIAIVMIVVYAIRVLLPLAAG